MSAILTNVASLATTMFTVAGDAVDFVTENPVCLIGVCSMLLVTGIGIARNLIRGV